jgi:hypothetical protein
MIKYWIAHILVLFIGVGSYMTVSTYKDITDLEILQPTVNHMMLDRFDGGIATADTVYIDTLWNQSPLLTMGRPDVIVVYNSPTETNSLLDLIERWVLVIGGILNLFIGIFQYKEKLKKDLEK